MHTASPTFPASIPLAITRAQQLLLALALVALVSLWQGGPYLTMRFFREQDLPVALVLLLVFAVWKLLMAGKGPVDRLAALAYRLERLSPTWPAVFTVVAGAAGSWIVFGLYPLSMDEFWAVAGGEIIASGSPMGRLPEEWAPYAEGLQPIFSRIVPEGFWMSQYLPVNSLLQLLLGPLASPLLAGGAVLITADLARRLMPGRRSAPVVCAILMVTSSQLLLTAMTPYAMSAHLAFNMGWLWLFLHRTRIAQIAAVPIAFLATGLHQFAFFPLFALPFILEAWLAGRREKAAFHLAMIGAGVVAWANYDTLVYAWLEVTPPAAAATGAVLVYERLLGFLGRLDLASFGIMALNLVRFILWQNLIAVPLFLLCAHSAFRAGGTWRAMIGGMSLTLAMMMVVMAYQGHGWGYRYLHGMLGSLCLLATLGLFRLIEMAETPQAIRSIRAVWASALIASVALVPVRATMASQFTDPYRLAHEAIDQIEADVIFIDAARHHYSVDLVRNDPLLRNSPKRIAPAVLERLQLVEICSRYRVFLFTDAHARQLGLPDAGPSARQPTELPAPCPAPR
jgi:hypothetical protein